jgi:hypothetical protein
MNSVDMIRTSETIHEAVEGEPRAVELKNPSIAFEDLQRAFNWSGWGARAHGSQPRP